MKTEQKINVTELLDFSSWTLNEIELLKPLSDKQLKEAEEVLTNAYGEMSQIDHVEMVVTYKAKIKELEQLLDECFESAIAPLGAGEPMKPSSSLEDLANRVFQRLKQNEQIQPQKRRESHCNR